MRSKVGRLYIAGQKIGILNNPGLQESFLTPDKRLAQGGQAKFVHYGFFLLASPDFEFKLRLKATLRPQASFFCLYYTYVTTVWRKISFRTFLLTSIIQNGEWNRTVTQFSLNCFVTQLLSGLQLHFSFAEINAALKTIRVRLNSVSQKFWDQQLPVYN